MLFCFEMYFSYCHLLIQEMDVRVDIGFLLALMELFNNARDRTTEVSFIFNFLLKEASL